MTWPTEVPLQGNRQEELEIYDLAATTGTWWDESHDWSVTVNGYRLFKRTGEKGKVVGLPSTPRARLSMESCLLRTDMSRLEQEPETKAAKRNLCWCLQALDQGEPIDEALLLQLQKTWCSQALVLQGDLNHPEICWETCTVAVGNPGGSWNVCRITSWPR